MSKESQDKTMKLFVVIGQTSSGYRYKSMYVTAISVDDALSKLEGKGIKPDTWSGKFIIEEEECFIP